MTKRSTSATIPDEVVNRLFDRQMTPARAWREHLGITVEDASGRIGCSPSAYVHLESTRAPIRVTRQRLSCALGIQPAQLDLLVPPLWWHLDLAV